MPNVEGLTPNVLWTTVYGMLALCILFMIIFKVYDAIHTIQERRKQRRETERPDFAEAVSQRVIEKLEPRFTEIEKNLAKDKSRLDNHEMFIADIQKSQRDTRDGLVVICKYLIAISQYGNFGGESEEIKNATSEMMKYLASRIGGNSK